MQHHAHIVLKPAINAQKLSCCGESECMMTILLSCCAAGSIFDLLNSDDRASWKAKASSWLEGIYATIAITVVVFFALFLDDFRLAVLPTSLDVSCEYISGLILVCSQAPWNRLCTSPLSSSHAQAAPTQG